MIRGFVGQCRGAKLIAKCNAAGLGEMTQPSEFPPRRFPWILDNGAFKLWRSGKPFDGAKFWSVVERAAEHNPRPEFVVCPDVVAGGLESLALSLAWADRIEPTGLKMALVVQDGMTEADVAPHLHRFAVLFIGGSLEWKLATLSYWARVARDHGIKVHAGRIGGRKRMLLAKRAGIDSVDSCVPLFSDGNMSNFLNALTLPGQVTLFDILSRHQLEAP